MFVGNQLMGEQGTTCYSMGVLISLPEKTSEETHPVSRLRWTATLSVGERPVCLSVYLCIYPKKHSNLLSIDMDNSECFPLSLAFKLHS